jgi:endogenous inhibitor of DNA gyrase (YacG/DUF329 family)
MNPRCPICGKPAAAEYRPFCSRRCADVDLQRWLSGLYAVPAVEGEADPDDDRQGSERLSGLPKKPPL